MFIGTDWSTGSSVFTMPQTQKMQEISFGLKFGDVLLLLMSFGLFLGVLWMDGGISGFKVVKYGDDVWNKPYWNERLSSGQRWVSWSSQKLLGPWR